MSKADFILGVSVGIELALLALRRAKDVEDARKRLERVLGPVTEKKIEELAKELGYPLPPG